MIKNILFSILFWLVPIQIYSAEISGAVQIPSGIPAIFELETKAAWVLTPIDIAQDKYFVDSSGTKIFFASPIEGSYTIIASYLNENHEIEQAIHSFNVGSYSPNPQPDPTPPPPAILTLEQSYADRNKDLINQYKTEEERNAEREKQFENAIKSRLRFEEALEKSKKKVADIQEKINNLEDKRTRSDFGSALGYDETQRDKLQRDLMFAQESVSTNKAALSGYSSEQLIEAQKRFRAEMDAKADAQFKKEEDAKNKQIEAMNKERDRLAQEEEKRLEGLKKQTDSYIDLIKTQDEKMQDEINNFRNLIKDVEGTQFAFSQEEITKIEASITEKYSDKKSPTLAEQAGNLSAMSMGSLEAYQTIKQSRDPNTKLLDDMLLVQNNQLKELKTVSDKMKEQIEILSA